MRRLLSLALVAAVAVPTFTPVAASAQSRELYRDRRDIQDERRDLQRAYQRGDRGDIRDAREDYREAHREYREDRRDYQSRRNYQSRPVYSNRYRNYGRNDWFAYRNQNRAVFARGNWRAPFRYRTFQTGYRIQPAYYGSRYVIADPYRYHLPRAQGYSRWVRHYNDVLLVDYRRGTVLQVLRNFFW